ncbi:MAG: hypothetical protein ACREBQ_01370 [Nitrososphaerales archaeon]
MIGKKVPSAQTLEGKTKLAVPSLSEPQKVPAFFNPRGKLVRDVSIVCYQALGNEKSRELTFADALSGTGARGIRVAKEVDSFGKVFLNDTNSAALQFAKESAELNRVAKRCVFSQSEACSFLLSREENGGERFDCVDIDPFGTPSDFVDCGIRAVKEGGVLSVTATDSAVLCGVYPRVALRKYLGLPLRTDYCHEVGMRLLFGLLSLTAMRFEVGIRPLFCHHDQHYFRAYCEVRVGNSYSRENEKEIGFVLHCFVCGYRTTISRDEFFSAHSSKSTHEAIMCPGCGKGSPEKRGKLVVGGPCWIGRIQSKEFTSRCASKSDLALFNMEELDIPLYYDLTDLSAKLGMRTPKISDVMLELKSKGHLASRTRLNPTAVRTDAAIATLLDVVKELAQ